MKQAITVDFTPEAFLVQEFGGVSRCFAELARALELEVSAKAERVAEGVAERAVHPRIHALIHGNAHLRELSPSLVRGVYLPIKGDLRKLAIHLPRLAFAIGARLARPQIVHDTGYAFAASRAHPFPVLVTVHDMLQEADPDFARTKVRAIAVKRRAIANATRIVVPSADTRDELVRLERVDPARIEVVHHGARMPAPSHEHPNRGRPYFLHVGARKRYKGFATAVRAFARVQRGGFDGDLLTVTRSGFDAAERGLQRELGVREGSVRTLAADDHALATLYAHARGLVVPSRGEGFGIPILEAMSLGCPVACMRVIGCAEVAGDAALLAEPGDEAALAANLSRFVDETEERTRCVARGRARAAELSWESAARAYAALVRSLVA
jgi:glycosyltransferase involved in cell wall biosynthesis